MIKNKQVNIWRGPDTPPTNYHIWFKDEKQLLRYDEDANEWVIFLDSSGIVDVIADFLQVIDNLTINGKSIKSSPVLDGSDIRINQNGHYIKQGDTIQQAALKLDSLLTTKVYDQ